MGLGYVPPRSLRQASQGDDLPGREHRGAGAHLPDLTDRRTLAVFGEAIAAAFLERRGAEIVDRNVYVGRGEIDLIVRHDHEMVAVEVKTIGPDATASDPIDRIDDKKLCQVRRLAAQAGRHRIRRVDFVGVRVGAMGVLVNWRTNVA